MNYSGVSECDLNALNAIRLDYSEAGLLGGKLKCLGKAPPPTPLTG